MEKVSAWYAIVSNNALLATIVGTVIATAIIAITVKWGRVLWAMLDLAVTAIRVAGTALARWLASPITLRRYYLVSWVLLCAGLTYASRFWPWPWRVAVAVVLLFAVLLLAVRPRSARRADPGTISDEDRAILKFIASGQGQAVSLQMIAGRFQWHARIAERFVDHLAEAGFLKFTQGYGGTSIELSDAGIDYAIYQGWLSIKRPTMT
jgi:hypothetical protein